MIWSFLITSLLIGTTTFGGGYAMISALQQELVLRKAWMTPAEFANGVAVGQVTPGPLMIMVAFMGYKIAGFWGAFLGTVGLFAPSFVLAIVLSHSYQRVKEDLRVAAVMKGVNAAVVGLLAAAAVSLARTSLNNIYVILIAGATAFVSFINQKWTTWALLAAGAMGALLIK